VLGKLDRDESAEIYRSMRSAFLSLKESAESGAAVATQADEAPQALRVYGRALHGEADAQALEMLASILPGAIAMKVDEGPRLIGELVHELEVEKPVVFCISAMPLRARHDAKNLCLRVRSKLPDLKILVCRWGLPGQEHDPKPLRDAGATWVVSSFKEAREVLEKLVE
jgi:hypothetical protein